jgi:ABC-type glycerol-3-phosphate transport system substrate-binding protein
LIRGYAPGPDDLRGVTDGTRGLFNSGRIAFYFGIRSEVSNFNVPFGTVPVHKMPNGKEYNRDGPNGVSLTQAGKHRDAAWQFLTFVVTRGVEINVGVGLTAPTTRSLAKQPSWLNKLIGGENAAAYDAAASQVKAIPHPPGLTDIDKLIQDAYGKVVNGQAAAGPAMQAIKPQIDAILMAAGK